MGWVSPDGKVLGYRAVAPEVYAIDTATGASSPA